MRSNAMRYLFGTCAVLSTLAVPAIAAAGAHFSSSDAKEFNGMQRGWSPEGNFNTTDADGVARPKEGWVMNYFSPDADNSPVRLWRLYKPSSNDHFYTTDPVERDQAASRGYIREDSAKEMWVFP